jgi:hypothetical protein
LLKGAILRGVDNRNTFFVPAPTRGLRAFSAEIIRLINRCVDADPIGDPAQA